MTAAKVSHAVRNDVILITAEVNGKPVTLDGMEWKTIARAVLREYNAAENARPPDLVVSDVRESLADAALRGLEPVQKDLQHRRMVSTVLHRLADMIQAGTINEFEGGWLTDAPDEIELDIVTRHGRKTTLRIALGRGIIAPEAA